MIPMPRITPFENHASQYEAWFANNPLVYQAELNAVHSLLPPAGFGIEIGAGTGRFASRLGVTIGLEPSPRMRAVATQRGIKVLSGVAEKLPLRSAIFDFALMVTTVCFLDNPHQAFREVYRILKKDGCFLVAFVDRKSPLGQLYEANKGKSVFYRDATFYSTDEVLEMMEYTGFSRLTCQQTIFHGLAETRPDEPVLPGYGKGSFVVLRGTK
jgi:SAM-dependent methyltransferase